MIATPVKKPIHSPRRMKGRRFGAGGFGSTGSGLFSTMASTPRIVPLQSNTDPNA